MICPRCKGRGEVADSGKITKAILTGFLSTIIWGLTNDCPICKGEGVIKDPDKE
jgi:hypothetical protein